MPVSAGSLYDYYNPFAGTQRNLDRFVDLYERKKQRGLQERGMGLEERRLNLGERQENRIAGSQGIDDQYKQMLINRETEELKMRQDLMNDPATRVSIMSKALKEAYTTGGKKIADSVLKSFQANPKYSDDTKGYTIEDFTFTPGGGLYAPARTTEGERLEGIFDLVDSAGKLHQIDMREKEGTKPSSVQEYEFSKKLPEGEKAEYEKFATNKGTIISLAGKAETKEQEGIGTYRSKIYEGIQEDAKTARNEIDTYSTLQELMNKTATGALEGAKTQIASYAQSMGVPVNTRWSVNQTIEAISNKLTIMARKVGEGQILAGQISDSDRKFLKASVPGLDKMPNANKMLIDWNIKLAQRKIDIAEIADEYFDANGTMKGFNEVQRKWVENNPLFGDTIQPSLDDIFKGYSNKNSQYELRKDGTKKGLGYFGELKRPDGRVSTELSIGVNIDGKEIEIPSLVPTLSKQEIDHLLGGGNPTKEIVGKAVEHARKRISQGKGPFAEQD